MPRRPISRPGWGLDFYLADELNGCTSDYSAIKTMGANAHAANRSVKTMMTIKRDGFQSIRCPSTIGLLLDSVQQWPALPFTGGRRPLELYQLQRGIRATHRNGWWDYPPINERIQAGFLNWTQGATGILYYRLRRLDRRECPSASLEQCGYHCVRRRASEDRAMESSSIRLARSLPPNRLREFV